MHTEESNPEIALKLKIKRGSIREFWEMVLE